MERIDLCQIDPEDRDYKYRLLTLEEILPWFEQENAFWVYGGEPSPEKPHAELTSGMCSNGFIDCLLVLRYPNIAEILGRQLFWLLKKWGVNQEDVDWVVSSSYAAITFGHEVAKALKAKFMMVEKDPNDSNQKKMLWRRMTIPAGARVLQIEDLITTSGTFREVRRAVEDGNAEKPVNFLPIIGALVHRPPRLPMDHYNSLRVIALIEREIQIFHPKECPYCKVGSPRYRPKTNWSKLTGKE